MRIFDWVQRKLHQNVIKDGLGKNVKKIQSSEIDNNTKAILQQVGLVDFLENWVDGSVLTIGTFGFDTLKCSDDKQKNVAGDDDDEDDDTAINSMTDYRDDEEMDPLISDKFDCDEIVHILGSDDVDDLGFGIMDFDSTTAVDCVDLVAVDVDRCHRQKMRTTLAELFISDADYSNFEKSSANLSFEYESDYEKYKLINRSKYQLSSVKKTSRGKDQDSHPIKKIHQMMRRMLKRKIHPDIDARKHGKSEGQKLLNVNPGPMV